ncbi:MAG: heme-binding protein [Planctomycetales bacterium]|nr:heme-binding protein [Planctomycetales bacterium]
MSRPLMLLLAVLCLTLDLGAVGAQDSPAGVFKTLPGFQVDLVYSVPIDSQGSWVSMCVDPRGRILACDQYGKIYRLELKRDGKPNVEQLNVNIGMAQGMLYAYDSLYININARRRDLEGTDAEGPGVYRLTDTNGDDQFDKIEYIVPMTDQAGEHGPHALVLGPDKKIYFCSGNQTDVPEQSTQGTVPRHWDEDHLLGRMPDGRGFMRDRLAPGGWICRMDPDGSNVELLATGFRNEYDIAFNEHGDLFTYDADMEWDIGTPWYRPTRINHVISGAEFGWRNGTGKWPDYYGDSFGAVVNIGPGSPTGITFGAGARFPAKYQKALFINDWSYGVMYAVHMTPDGSSYRGEFESFVTAAPMAVTDVLIHPDGNMYFAVGGRRTSSALYRLSYTGNESTAPASISQDSADVVAAREQRRQLERFHGSSNPAAIGPALKGLSSDDRAIRFAARIALEFQPVGQWREQALQLTDPKALITVSYALARTGSKQDQAALLSKLGQLNFELLDTATKLELLRAYELVWIRLGEPSESQRMAAIRQLDAHFPGTQGLVNRELAAVLVYLKAPRIVERVVGQLRMASAQEDQIHYAFCLRDVEAGWNQETRKEYFQWFYDVATARGGASFGGFLGNIRNVALSNLSNQQKSELGELASDKMPEPRDPLADYAPRPLVNQWTVDQLVAELAKLDHKPNFEKGRAICAVALCFKCHRFAGQGGIQGPDLTAASGRFNQKDLLTAIVEPNKEISDQYQATQFVTDEGVVVGRVANLNGNRLSVVTNMLAPGDFTNVDVDGIIERRPSPQSMMPTGLLDTFQLEEIADLVAYLTSGGNAAHGAYGQ